MDMICYNCHGSRPEEVLEGVYRCLDCGTSSTERLWLRMGYTLEAILRVLSWPPEKLRYYEKLDERTKRLQEEREKLD